MKKECKKHEFHVSDMPSIVALNCPTDSFPAIEEVNIEPDASDKKRLNFIFEDSTILRSKLEAFRKGELRAEPSKLLFVFKQIRQEIKYLKDSVS